MGDDTNRHWTYLANSHSIALSQLKPGTYQLAIRSTNSDGVWGNNERRLTIIVTPTFWETPWAILLITLLVLAMGGGALYTTLYIRRLKRQQHETMEKYMALMEGLKTDISPQEPSPEDALMKRLVAFVEENIGNNDVSIDDMAQACAVSRTGLHRKVKSLTGTSPMEFMREVRIRKAIQQLRDNPGKSVSQIAYECGFSDPRYFSKCFKSATGQTPTEFRGAAIE